MSVPDWKIKETHPQEAQQLEADLREVMDPELGMDIIQLGLVRDVEITEEGAQVTMIMTTPFCPYAPQLLESCRAKTEESLDLPTEIELGDEVWDRTFMENGEDDWGLY
ncbi:MAG: iron-sulfur cluster assembly protein [Anaerolineales bacterium]